MLLFTYDTYSIIQTKIVEELETKIIHWRKF
jgi:hypothetical protein